MTGKSPLSIGQSIWIRSALVDQQYIFRSIRDALIERGINVISLKGPNDTDGIEKIRQTVWNSDAHVIMDGLIPSELHKLRPIFEKRKNFSMSLVDWWTSVYWFTQNADYLIFRNYNGIAVRLGLTRFMANRKPPLITLPDKPTRYGMICSALRLPALATAAFVDLQKAGQRQLECFTPERLLYFPFSIAEEHVPLKAEPIKFDFSNICGTGGYWTMRDPHASAWLNYGNLYYDRIRITKLIKQTGKYRVFDLRKSHYLKWSEYCQTAQCSRFAMATGGLHQNSVAKYTEFACLGTPMLGEEIPYEFPWLKECLFPVDTLNATRHKLEPQLDEALALQPKLRENCLNIRDHLLKLYHPHAILDMLQEQANGQPVRPGYLKVDLKQNTTAHVLPNGQSSRQLQ